MGWREVVLAAGSAPFVYLVALELLARIGGLENSASGAPHGVLPSAVLLAITAVVYLACRLRSTRVSRSERPAEKTSSEPREVAITDFALHLDRRRMIDLRRHVWGVRATTLDTLRNQLAALPSARDRGIDLRKRDRTD